MQMFRSAWELARRLMPLVALAFAASQAGAQIRSGTVTGTVTDPSGAPVPGAKVEVLQDETKVSHETTTNASGEYSVPYLQAGAYTATVTATGFPPFRVTDINVYTAQIVRIDVQLQLSQVSTQIEVSASVENLQTESSSVQSAVRDNIINAVPNISQNPLYYATLQAGVVGRMEMALAQAPQSFGVGFDGRRFSSAFNVNGGAAFTNDIQLDGLSVMGSAWNEATVLPNTDSLQEVRAATNNYSAEYGRGQGVVEMVTRSGANQFHGGLYYRNRNEAFNANTFQNNTNAIQRPAFRVHDLGGSFGGAIIKDKLFFFTSYEQLLHSDGPEWLLTVPTAAQRKGDFSQMLITGLDGQPVPATIFDPNSVTQVAANVYQRMPYPNVTIPNPNPAALKIMDIYPQPNRAPTDVYGHNNFFTSATRTFRRSSSNNRLDYHRSRHSLYASGGISVGEINTPSPYGTKSPFFIPATVSNSYGSAEPEYVSDDNPYVQVGDTVILNPSTVLDVRYGLTRIHSNFLSNTAQNFTATDYSSYGVPAPVQAVMPQFGAAPDLPGPGFYSNASWAQYNNKRERQTNQQVSGSLTKQLGRWSLKAGGEVRLGLSNYTDYQNAATAYNAGPGNYTAQYITATGGSAAQNVDPTQLGFAGANLLAGGGGWLVAQTFSPRPALSQKYFAIYSQNDWHATSRLTLNLGLRWEVQPAPTDRFNRASVLDLTRTNAFGTPGMLVFPGHDGLSRSLWNTDWRDFGPRIGVAYRLGDAWVLRGGYGITYAPNNTGWYDGPYVYAMGAFAPGAQVLPYGTNPNGSLVGHFWDAAASPIIAAVGANSAAPQIYGTGFPFFNVNSELPPRIQQFNVFVERQISRSWFASAGYSGSRGSRLLESRYPLQNAQNVPGNVLDSWRQTYIASNALTNPGIDQVPNPLQPASGSLLPFPGTLGQRNIPRINTYFPYLALLNDSLQNDAASSRYDSLQVRARHSFANGLFLDASYLWSKSLDTAYTELQDRQGFSDTTSAGAGTNGLDILNMQNNNKLSYSDVPHRFVGMVTYELPFGKGRKFELSNPVGRAMLGHWQFGSVITLQSGFPLAPTGANSGAIDGRPNLVPGQPLVLPGSLQRWYDGKTIITLPDGRPYTPCAQCFLKYNPDAFAGQIVTLPNGKTNTDPYWMGNAAIDYGQIRGPGRNNVDLTLSRDFRLREKMQMSFRANVTNVFNHTQFLGNAYNMGLGGTVAVAAQGVAAGMGSSNSYGTHGLTTYDPREMILELRLLF